MKTTLKVVLVLFVLLLNIGCEEEETTSGDNCDAQVENLSDIMLEKNNAFQSNPTESNCNAFRTAWLNLYYKMVDCGYPTAELDIVKPEVEALDCGVFNEGGGGGTGGGGGGTGSGSAMIWTQVDHGCGNISVTVNGSTQTISSYYSSGAPSCGASGCANFSLPPGSYNVTASCSSKNWSGTVTVTANGCYKLQLLN